MKEILLIGKPNDILRDIHSYLSNSFKIQICTPDRTLFSGIMKVTTPDLVLVSLVGIHNIDPLFIRMVAKQCVRIPVVTIGTQAEFERFLAVYRGRNFKSLIRPVENEDILNMICKCLHINKDSLPKEKKESSGKIKVLVVDDDGTTLRMLKTMLENDYEVTLATSGSKAMAAMGRDKPDVILLDYEMPICDGAQTLKMIRADNELEEIPVIFLTAVADRKHIEAVIGLNPSGYLLKPPVKEKLDEQIRLACAGWSLRTVRSKY